MPGGNTRSTPNGLSPTRARICASSSLISWEATCCIVYAVTACIGYGGHNINVVSKAKYRHVDGMRPHKASIVCSCAGPVSLEAFTIPLMLFVARCKGSFLRSLATAPATHSLHGGQCANALVYLRLTGVAFSLTCWHRICALCWPLRRERQCL